MRKLIVILLCMIYSASQVIYSTDVNHVMDSLLKKSEELMYTNPKQSAYYAKSVLSMIGKSEGNRILRVKSLIAYGNANQLQGDFDLAIKNYHEALGYITTKDEILLAIVQMRLSNIYCTLQDFPKAFDFIGNATALYKSLGDSIGLATCYNSQGIIHCNLHEYEASEQFFLNAAKINRKLNDRKALAGNLNNLALYQGDAKQKIDDLEEAISINKSLNAIWSLAENYNNLGRQYFYAFQYEKAANALKIAEMYAQEIGAKELICDNYEYKSHLYAARKKYKEAYEFLIKLQELQVSLQSTKNLRNIEREMAERKFFLKEKEFELSEKTYEIELLNRNTLVLIIALVSLIVLSILGSKWYRRKRIIQLMESNFQLEQSNRKIAELQIQQQQVEIKDIEQELLSSKHELTNFAMYLKSRNELLEKIKELIKQGCKLDLLMIVDHLKKINIFISQYQSGKLESSVIFESIEHKNKEYIERLMKVHPDLTQVEKKLAILLRVNFSTKDISLLTGVQPKTINMNRYRLRKKMELNSEEDLTGYLQSI